MFSDKLKLVDDFVLNKEEIYLQKVLENLKPIEREGVVHSYLESRSIKYETYANFPALKEIDLLNYWDEGKQKKLPAMIGIINTDSARRFPSVHRTFLEEPSEIGDKWFKSKRVTGSFRGGRYIPLFEENSEPHKIIAVTEGIETGLSVIQFSGLPVYCLISSGNLKNFIPPHGTEEVYIFADNDNNKTGFKASKILQMKLRSKLIKSYIITAPGLKPTGTDWNDVIIEKNDDEVQEFYKRTLKSAKEEFEQIKDTEKSAYDVALEITNKLDEIFPNRNGLFYTGESWYKYDQKKKYFKNIPESKVIEVIVDFMHDRGLYAHKITKNFTSNIVLNLKAFLSKRIELPAIEDDNIETKHALFFNNGNFVINDGKVERMNTDDNNVFNDYRSPVDFDSTKDSFPTWRSFLDDISQGDEKFVLLLQEFFGYCLNANYDFHKFLFIYGRGRNGKGVIAKVLTCLVGEENTSSLSIDDLSKTFRISKLSGALVNITNEGSFKNSFNEALFKDLSAGGRVTVERKYEQPFDMVNITKFVILSNEPLVIQDNSDAGWARAIVLPIKFQLKDEKDYDPRLSDSKCWFESGELPGILNWALEGRIRLYKNNCFTRLPSSADFIEESKSLSNPTRFFLQEFFESDGKAYDHFIPTSRMYKQYTSYCEESGLKPLSINYFSREISLVFSSATKTSRVVGGKKARGWLGIKKKSAEQERTEQSRVNQTL